MPITKITIPQFLQLQSKAIVIDVRSQGEYEHANIPNAVNIPLFNNEERKIVGITYKQNSREEAIKIGLDFFGPKMKTIIENIESIFNKTSQNEQQEKRSIVVHCWRGGMRSAAVAWLLDLYGFTVYTIVGGYKAYRKWILHQFEKKYNLTVIGGYTGSGKTKILEELHNQHHSIINLEKLANHKGSTFGNLGKQPTQEMFENLLANELSTINQQPSTVFVEDESQRIGNVKIPNELWNNIRESNILFIDIPFEERLNNIVEEYGSLPKEFLIEGAERIQKRLGGLETKNTIEHIKQNNIEAAFTILLTYYDKWYNQASAKRENLTTLLNKIPCASVNTTQNVKLILACSLTKA